MISFQHVFYQIHQKMIVEDINLIIHDGEKILMEGESGSGKSTLFNLLMGNIDCSKGAIFFNQRKISDFSQKEKNEYRRNKITLILQQDDLYPQMTVFENLTMFSRSDEVIFYLKKTKLFHLKDQLVSSLSGGERQRIAIIKSCLKECEVLLCDEVTSALDMQHAIEIIHFIFDLFADKTILFISHTPGLFQNIVSRKITIQNRKIVSDLQLCKDISHAFKEKKSSKTKRHFYFQSRTIKKSFFLQMIIFLIGSICFSIIFSFQEIMEKLALQTCRQYYDYNVFEVQENKHYTEDQREFFNSLDSLLQESSIWIDEIIDENIELRPHFFIQEPLFVMNDLLAAQFPGNKMHQIRLTWKKKQLQAIVKVIIENQLFSTPVLYYSYFSLRDFYNQSDSSKLYFISETISLNDSRFSINPLYEKKERSLPYLNSNAMKEYLTYQLLIDSLTYIVQGYALLIFLYCLATSVFLLFATINQDQKELAILLQRGVSSFRLLVHYLFPLCLISLFSLLLLLWSASFFYGILFTFMIQLTATVFSYLKIKKTSVHELLKEDFLC